MDGERLLRRGGVTLELFEPELHRRAEAAYEQPPLGEADTVFAAGDRDVLLPPGECRSGRCRCRGRPRRHRWRRFAARSRRRPVSRRRTRRGSVQATSAAIGERYIAVCGLIAAQRKRFPAGQGSLLLFFRAFDCGADPFAADVRRAAVGPRSVASGRAVRQSVMKKRVSAGTSGGFVEKICAVGAYSQFCPVRNKR